MSTEQVQVPGIYKKLHAIMSEANYIQKDKENPHFHYWYASEAAIKEKLHELFVKHRVVFNASAMNAQTVESHKNDKGKSQFRTTLDLAYRFFDIDDGSFVDGTMAGAGMDGEDKGTYKAITGALKYCLTSQFVIPTGDDPESENGERPKKEQKQPNRETTSTTIGAPVMTPPPVPRKPAAETPVNLADILKTINSELLGPKEFEFVAQIKDRLAQYGDRIKITDKQINWLKRIAAEQSEQPAEDIANARGFSPRDYTA